MYLLHSQRNTDREKNTSFRCRSRIRRIFSFLDVLPFKRRREIPPSTPKQDIEAYTALLLYEARYKVKIKLIPKVFRRALTPTIEDSILREEHALSLCGHSKSQTWQLLSKYYDDDVSSSAYDDIGENAPIVLSPEKLQKNTISDASVEMTLSPRDDGSAQKHTIRNLSNSSTTNLLSLLDTTPSTSFPVTGTGQMWERTTRKHKLTATRSFSPSLQSISER